MTTIAASAQPKTPSPVPCLVCHYATGYHAIYCPEFAKTLRKHLPAGARITHAQLVAVTAAIGSALINQEMRLTRLGPIAVTK